VGKHALQHDDAALARLAMDGGLAELGALRAAAAQEPERKPIIPVAGKMDAQAARRAAFDAGRETAADPPAPKYPHLGRHATRWNFLLHAYADRGWAVRGDVPGEEGSLARRSDLVPESEVLAAAAEDARALEAAGPARPKPVDKGDTTPPKFGVGLGRRVVVDGTAYRVQKFLGRKVALTSWMRRRTRASVRALRKEREKAAREAKERAGKPRGRKRVDEWEEHWEDEYEHAEPAPAPLPAYVLRRSADGSAAPESMMCADPVVPTPQPERKKFELPAYMKDFSMPSMVDYRVLKGGMNSEQRARAMREAKAHRVAMQKAEMAARKGGAGKAKAVPKKSGIGKGGRKKKKGE
jgi:hypothetical protein